MWRCLCDPRFSHLRTTLTCDGQTDKQTYDDSIYRASIARAVIKRSTELKISRKVNIVEGVFKNTQCSKIYYILR